MGINGFSEGDDALALGAALAGTSKAELLLVAVHPELLVVLPSGMDWRSLRSAARATLQDARNRMAPEARTTVESDVSVPRALMRVVRRDHRDLLVLGSSRHAHEGHILIGKRTRQLLGQFECALAVAPRGLHRHGTPSLTRIGVGYDGGPEAQAALEVAASLAAASRAQLLVHAVVDDRLPPIGWTSIGRATTPDLWRELRRSETEALISELDAATNALGVPFDTAIHYGRPADALLAVSTEVDLLVIGSRRWGPVARVILGSTGEALLHDACCPVVAVPRPPD